MRQYSTKIALTKNSRGIYSLDTSIGCSSGMANNKGGCYNDCYAAKSAKLYGYDFSKTVLRSFENKYHEHEIINAISRIDLDFVRIGTMGDPSENWEHTLQIMEVIKRCNKNIVIITKHWTNLTSEQMERISSMRVCINTSVSALDKPELLENSLQQYHILKQYCKSVLRIVSADFNTDHPDGLRLSILQHNLFKNEDTLDTVLRVNKHNPYVKEGIINIKQGKFLGKKQWISKFNKKTYLGKCGTCKEMCGITGGGMKPLAKQNTLFS